jgi:hypothetical protein
MFFELEAKAGDMERQDTPTAKHVRESMAERIQKRLVLKAALRMK